MRAYLPFIVYFCLILLIFWHIRSWQRYSGWGERLTMITFLIYMTAVMWLCLTPAHVNIPSAQKILFHFHASPTTSSPFKDSASNFS